MSTFSEQDQFPLFRIGQEVDTPSGPGVITDIAIHAARYGNRTELEPPVITVKMADPDTIPQELTVCMCKLGLGDSKKEEFISAEFQRLWPPIETEIEERAATQKDFIAKLPKWEDGSNKPKKYVKYAGTVYKLVK